MSGYIHLRHSQHGFYLQSANSPYPELHAKAYNAPWLSIHVTWVPIIYFISFLGHSLGPGYGCLAVTSYLHLERQDASQWTVGTTCEMHVPLLHTYMLCVTETYILYMAFSWCSASLNLYAIHWPARYNLGEWFNMSEKNGRILTPECARDMMNITDAWQKSSHDWNTLLKKCLVGYCLGLYPVRIARLLPTSSWVKLPLHPKSFCSLPDQKSMYLVSI